MELLFYSAAGAVLGIVAAFCVSFIADQIVEKLRSMMRSRDLAKGE